VDTLGTDTIVSLKDHSQSIVEYSSIVPATALGTRVMLVLTMKESDEVFLVVPSVIRKTRK
jgi:hypothetical protein